MKTQGLDVFYDSDFEQFLAEDHDAATLKKDTDDALRTYCSMFHEPFFNIEDTSINVSDEELYRWVSWCIFYGRSKDEYPLANREIAASTDDPEDLDDPDDLLLTDFAQILEEAKAYQDADILDNIAIIGEFAIGFDFAMLACQDLDITLPAQLLHATLDSPYCEIGSYAYEIANDMLEKRKTTNAGPEPSETVVRG
ncbi:hypothetical protein CQR46_1574 [Bifidobacterium pseudolongum subsp. globosum]|uniref:Uncharacterized protein n=1 Tax=Bifidobacterium pseudolongum subsp. globosum TaxID=1690 RepID=A0A2N3QEB4_9BIFI|nr:hypothetical protein [Bifidobacterium pseudolongum]PKU88473.1 hypothetical protein CQR46_1574 [Bifidobacterium pseudolongum subsp. globosum]PKV04154.1 hypothetical protein CQR50_1066 [Bifidobacterium pseudolongum subsp. globosum]